MRVKGRLLALVIAGPLLVGVSACANKQVLQEGTGTGTPAKAGAGATAQTQQGPGAAKAAEKPAAADASAQKPSAQPPPGTAALAEAPRAVGDKGLAGSTTSGLARIHFGFDQSLLTPEAKEALQKNAKYLSSKPGAAVRIEGHCDERGTAEYNLALGERRATAARQYLQDLGVEAQRVKVVSYGKEVPLDPAHTEDAWAKNRRDEFVELKN